jgi:hypothetical protein
VSVGQGRVTTVSNTDQNFQTTVSQFPWVNAIYADGFTIEESDPPQELIFEKSNKVIVSVALIYRVHPA